MPWWKLLTKSDSNSNAFVDVDDEPIYKKNPSTPYKSSRVAHERQPTVGITSIEDTTIGMYENTHGI